MTVVSKDMIQKIAHKTCKEVFHPFENKCRIVAWNILIGSFKGSLKFYSVIYILQILINSRKFTWNYLKKQCLLFPRSILYGICMGVNIVQFTCIIRKITGSFNYYSAISVPGFIGGLAIFIENAQMKTLNTIMFVNMALQFVICASSPDLFRRSAIINTLFFMITNAGLMYLLRFNALAPKATCLWFYNPNRSTNKDLGNVCCSGIKCHKHILQDSLKFFGYGYAFQIAKSIVPKIPKLIKNPLKLFAELYNKNSLKFGLFLSSYICIFEIVSRKLYDIFGKQTGLHILFAGFLAGVSYSIKPNLYIGFMPITLILQILWINIFTKYKLPNWPFKEVLFALCSGLLLHARVILPNYCPRYIFNMLKICTNSRSEAMFDSFTKIIHN